MFTLPLRKTPRTALSAGVMVVSLIVTACSATTGVSVEQVVLESRASVGRLHVTQAGAVQSGSATAICRKDEKAIAGGYEFEEAGYRTDYQVLGHPLNGGQQQLQRPIPHLFRVTASYPSTERGDPGSSGAINLNAWTVKFAGALWADRNVTVIAYCVKASFNTVIGSDLQINEAPSVVAVCPSGMIVTGGGFIGFPYTLPSAPAVVEDYAPVYTSSAQPSAAGILDSWRVADDAHPLHRGPMHELEAFAVCVPSHVFALIESHQIFRFEQPSSEMSDCCAVTDMLYVTDMCPSDDFTIPIGYTIETLSNPSDVRVVADWASDTSWAFRVDAGTSRPPSPGSGYPIANVDLFGYCLQAVGAIGSAADPSLGPATAPVTIVEYGDFGCPNCKAWHQAGVLKQVLAKYGNKVRFVWRDFPIITPQSPKAAEAGQCAFEQGKFWPYHDLLFDRAPALSIDDLKAYALQVGLDTAKFNQCLDSGRYAAKVARSKRDAYAHGFIGTPGFLVNGRAIAGPPSFEYLSSLIDSILASK